MSDDGPSVFVQRQMTVATPVSAATLVRLLADVPPDAEVETLDGELIAVRWQRHEGKQTHPDFGYPEKARALGEIASRGEFMEPQ